MARVGVRRSVSAAAIATALVLLLAACFLLPTPSPGESDSGMSSVDTTAIADAITATTPTITSTSVDTSLDGLTTMLHVGPSVTTSLTAPELDAVLRVAYAQSLGQVATIEVRTVDADNRPVDVKAAATELGIHFLPHVNSVTYSTTTLDTVYGK
ncbi:MAG: hypothetical protein ABI632_08195 [Pseudolysinimonas sp.]